MDLVPFIFCTPERVKSPTLAPLVPRQEALGPRYEWVDVGVLDYDPPTKLYHIKRVFVPNRLLAKNTVLPSTSSTSLKSDGGSSDGDRSDGEVSDGDDKVDSDDSINYWVPRVRLMFAAEDPTVFAERVSYAYQLRQQTEALLRYGHLI